MARTPTAGAMRERVTWQSATVTRDTDYNQEVESWSTLATTWAAVRVTNAGEPQLADRPVMVTGYEITARYPITGLTHHCRAVWRSKTIQIDSVTDDVAAGLVVVRGTEAQL